MKFIPSELILLKIVVLTSLKSSHHAKETAKMEQRALKNVNNCLNTDIYSYLVTPGG